MRVRWALDVNELMEIVDLIRNGTNNPDALSLEKRQGQEKIRNHLEWLEFLDLVEKRSRIDPAVLTPLAPVILRLLRDSRKDVNTIAYEILYHNWATRYPIGSWVVTRFAEEDKEFIKEDLTSQYDVLKIDLSDRTKVKWIKRQLGTELRILLSPQGFGQLGIVREIMGNKSKTLKFSKHIPSEYAAAYFLSALWPKGAPSISISFLIEDKTSFGRVFFLDRQDIVSLLRCMERKGWVNVEVSGDLFQVSKTKIFSIEAVLQLLNQIAQN